MTLAAGLAAALVPGAASAAQCGGDFQAFIAAFRREAAAAGISQRTLDTAFNGVVQDQKVLAFDRAQRGTFRKTFEQYVATRVGPARIKRGAQLMRTHAALLQRVEQQFGVPPEILVAIWGLETSFGGDSGKLPVVSVLTTMAHDCRRTELFQRELLAALQILDRGYLAPEQLRGAYAGELGQTQFLPSSYIKYAVDFDGSGRPDLLRSVPDVLASTANLLKTNGWQRGAPYREGTPNFEVLREWNRALIYRQTITYFAEQLKSAPAPEPAAARPRPAGQAAQ
jgi:lytic murein transglycosylase